ncbi:MAG: hypothetical protein EZS28_037078 [Streblomastix strix]|uniref:Uncharacterized protein n=1 Tax=Streblomastix strix TaxID=222440 RepID=A0A5J4U919_9EUKA|nr:MAG: hypothetical protein EZS28_037078 [Streblomastix strix]
MKSRAKPFDKLPFHPSMNQRTRKNGSPQFSDEVKDVFAALVSYLNRDIKKMNKLSSAVNLDDNVATSDNEIVYDNKNNAIYSVNGYTTAVGICCPEHQHKGNWKKQYYSDIIELERAALAAKLKQQGINDGPYMKWLSITKPCKEIVIRLLSFRASTADAKKSINTNGGAQLPMATKQQIMASAWNIVFITLAVDILERQDRKIDKYNNSNKIKIQSGQYEYLPLAKRLHKKELPTVIAQLYNDSHIGNKIGQALAQAMQYYGEILKYRQQNINGYKLEKYKFV